MSAKRRVQGYHLGYWDDSELSGRPSFWPDPRELVVAWPAAERRKIAAYLRRGTRVAACRGFSWCRFGCGANGSTELTDGVFGWPEGLAHYVSEHSVGLPDEFRQHAASTGYTIPARAVEKWRKSPDERQNAFLLWAMERSRAPKPRADALSLDAATARAAELSTVATPFSIEPYKGRWHIVGGHLDGYILPLRADELDELLAGAREPGAALATDAATALAAVHAGPDVQIVYSCLNSDPKLARLRPEHLPEAQAWLVSERTPFTNRSGVDRMQDAVGVELHATAARRVCDRMLAVPLTLEAARKDLGAAFEVTEFVEDGAVKWRIRHPRRSVVVDRPDRRSWREIRWGTYRAARAVPMSPDEAQATLRKIDPKVSVVAAGAQWRILGGRAEGLVPPFGDDDGYYRVLRDLRRAADPKLRDTPLEVLHQRSPTRRVSRRS